MTTEADMVQKALEDDTVLKVLCLTTGLSAREVVESLDELHQEPDSVPPLGNKGDIFIEFTHQLYFRVQAPFSLVQLEELLTGVNEALKELEADTPDGIYSPVRTRYISYSVCKNEGDQNDTN